MGWFRTIYPNLRAEAARRGLTVRDLAAVLDINPQAMRRRLLGRKNGGSDLTAWEGHLLCDYFGMSFEELFKVEAENHERR